MGDGTGVGRALGVGAILGVAVGVGLNAAAQYLPPVFTGKSTSLNPPQTIISVPVHTAVCTPRASGAFVVLVAVQLSVLGSYLPPVFNGKYHH